MLAAALDHASATTTVVVLVVASEVSWGLVQLEMTSEEFSAC